VIAVIFMCFLSKKDQQSNKVFDRSLCLGKLSKKRNPLFGPFLSCYAVQSGGAEMFVGPSFKSSNFTRPARFGNDASHSKMKQPFHKIIYSFEAPLLATSAYQ
jgi:hypothetical protein